MFTIISYDEAALNLVDMGSCLIMQLSLLSCGVSLLYDYILKQYIFKFYVTLTSI